VNTCRSRSGTGRSPERHKADERSVQGPESGRRVAATGKGPGPLEPLSRNVLVIDAHPDPDPARLCHALADAYAEGAESAGHHVELLRLADLDIPFLGSRDEFENREPGPVIRNAQASIEAAGHIVLIYPLWIGTMPAKLKAFLEQVFRPGFAFGEPDDGSLPVKKLTGRSARIIITMGMPALFYRWYFRAHSLKSLERNVLKFCGIKPVRETLLGMVEGVSGDKRRRWLDDMRELGAGAR